MAKGMVDMKRTAKERKGEEGGLNKSVQEDYPYGLSIRLDHHSLKKLGMHEGALPKVGSKVMLHAHAHVKSTSEHSEDGGNKRRHVELELRHMNLEGHGEGKKQEKPSGDSEEMNRGMKKAMDSVTPKDSTGPKEEGSEDADGDEE